MKKKTIFQFAVIALSTILFVACKKNTPIFCDGDNTIIATAKVFATGLNNPRGLKFGPDGNLYVAEGGIGGIDSVKGCANVPEVGPYVGSATGSRISTVNQAGVRTTFVDNLPSSKTATGEISGVGDVAFIGRTLYAVFAGAGCTHGVPSVPNGVIKVNPNRSWNMIANLSAYVQSHPVAHPDVEDLEPDGDFYSLVNVDGNLYTIEPNRGELLKVTTSGIISRVIDISATQGHIVPTAEVFHKGNFYVGNLGVFPSVPGASNVYKITPEGQISVYAKGFNDILGVAFDELGGLYVLEMTTNNPFPTPGTGDIVRIDPSGTRQVIVSGLNFPTAMTFGPDGKLYVSVWGFGMPPGGGQIMQVSFKCDKIRGDIKK